MFATFKTLRRLRICIWNMFRTLAWKLFWDRGILNGNAFGVKEHSLDTVSGKRNVFQKLFLRRGTFPENSSVKRNICRKMCLGRGTFPGN